MYTMYQCSYIIYIIIYLCYCKKKSVINWSTRLMVEDSEKLKRKFEEEKKYSTFAS